MTTSFKTFQPQQKYTSHQEEQQQIITTVLPPIVTTSYNSPLSYPVHSSNTHHRQTYTTSYQPHPSQGLFHSSNLQAPQNSSNPQRSRVETADWRQSNYGAPSRTQSNKLEAQSRMQYIPFQRKKAGFQTKTIVQKVPIQKTVIQYQAVKKINYVPKQKVITDYYVVEHQTAYIPRNIEEKIIEYVPVEKYGERIEYKPVQKQILHYPKDCDPSVAATISARHSNITNTLGFSGSVAQSYPKLSNVVFNENPINQTQVRTETINQSKVEEKQNNQSKQVVGNSVNKSGIRKQQSNINPPNKKTAEQNNLSSSVNNQPFVQSTYSLGQSPSQIYSPFAPINPTNLSAESVSQSFVPQGQFLVNSFGMPFQNIIFTNDFVQQSNMIPNLAELGDLNGQVIFASVGETFNIPPHIPGINLNSSSQFSIPSPYTQFGIPIINPLFPPQQFSQVIHHTQTQQQQQNQDQEQDNGSDSNEDIEGGSSELNGQQSSESSELHNQQH